MPQAAQFKKVQIHARLSKNVNRDHPEEIALLGSFSSSMTLHVL